LGFGFDVEGMLGCGEGTFCLLGFEEGVLFVCLGGDDFGVVGLGDGDERVYGWGI
jgi:hypothetical protein